MRWTFFSDADDHLRSASKLRSRDRAKAKRWKTKRRRIKERNATVFDAFRGRGSLRCKKKNPFSFFSLRLSQARPTSLLLARPAVNASSPSQTIGNSSAIDSNGKRGEEWGGFLASQENLRTLAMWRGGR